MHFSSNQNNQFQFSKISIDFSAKLWVTNVIGDDDKNVDDSYFSRRIFFCFFVRFISLLFIYSHVASHIFYFSALARRFLSLLPFASVSLGFEFTDLSQANRTHLFFRLTFFSRFVRVFFVFIFFRRLFFVLLAFSTASGFLMVFVFVHDRRRVSKLKSRVRAYF